MRFVPIADFPSRFDAEVAAQDLAFADVPYIIKSDDLAVGGSLSSLIGAELHVPEDLVEVALEILADAMSDCR